MALTMKVFVEKEYLFHLLAAFIRITIRHTEKYVYVSTYVSRQYSTVRYIQLLRTLRNKMYSMASRQCNVVQDITLKLKSFLKYFAATCFHEKKGLILRLLSPNFFFLLLCFRRDIVNTQHDSFDLPWVPECVTEHWMSGLLRTSSFVRPESKLRLSMRTKLD